MRLTGNQKAQMGDEWGLFNTLGLDQLSQIFQECETFAEPPICFQMY